MYLWYQLSRPPNCCACYSFSHSNIQLCVQLFFTRKLMLSRILNVLRSTYTITGIYTHTPTHTNKKKFWIGIQYVWALLLRPCEPQEQSVFSWQIMFTSKFKNTHAHLEEMPSRFLCDLSGHICSQYCLACGQFSFNCFVSALVHRNNRFGLWAATTHLHASI